MGKERGSKIQHRRENLKDWTSGLLSSQDWRFLNAAHLCSPPSFPLPVSPEMSQLTLSPLPTLELPSSGKGTHGQPHNPPTTPAQAFNSSRGGQAPAGKGYPGPPHYGWGGEHILESYVGKPQRSYSGISTLTGTIQGRNQRQRVPIQPRLQSSASSPLPSAPLELAHRLPTHS